MTPSEIRFSDPRFLLGLFLFALVVRLSYVLAGYWLVGPESLLGPDSLGFLQQAQFLADGRSAFTADETGAFALDINNMPVAFLLMALTLTAGQTPDPLMFVLVQCGFDSLTCLIIGWIVSRLHAQAAIAATVLAAVNPTQIVLSGLFYTDTVFTFFVAAALAVSIRWLERPGYGWCVLIGLLWGAALMTRAFVLYWLFLLPFLLLPAAAFLERRLRLDRLVQVGMAAICCIAVAAPILDRNYERYERISLSAQSGAHLLYWVLPLVKEFKDGTPVAETNVTSHRDLVARYPDYKALSPFAQSDLHAGIAREELRKLGLSAIAGAWTTGAILNLGAPATTIMPLVDNLPRQGFYGTPGDNTADKIFNFLTQDGASVYIGATLIGGMAMPVWLVFALLGFAAVCRSGGFPLATGLLLFLWAGYTLGINGPVVSPKYRLPLEPVWVAFFAIGITAAWTRLTGRRMRNAAI